jgi:hypothetical protein
MTAASSKSRTFIPDLEAATERSREANERFAEVGRKVTNAYLDGIEKYVAGLTEFERKLGEQSQIEAVANLFDGHAKMTEEVVRASVSAARELITA